MENFNVLRDGKKTAPLNIKITKELKFLILKKWNFDLYPDFALYKNKVQQIPFFSETDFITCILRKELLKSKLKFYWDYEVNNPDF